MAIQSFQLDPNAQAYTDNQIVDKVNAASNAINRSNCVASAAQDWSGKDSDDLPQGSTNLFDQGGPHSDNEVVTAINNASNAITREAALSQDDLNIVKTNPAASEFKVKNIHRDVDGKLDIEYDDVAV